MPVNNKAYIKNLKSIKDSYEDYAEQTSSPFTYTDFKKIATTFFKEFLDYLLEGHECKLPSGLGLFKIIKKKRDLTKLRPNWVETKKLWETNPDAKLSKKIVYHLNEHSKGYYYKFYWKKGRVSNISVYSFIPVRSAKRSLASCILNDNKDYIG
jgi:nucleoid DNA-binding protein